VLWVVLGGAYNYPSENLTYISSHLHTHSRQPSPQTAIHPAQPRRCILMYKHVPVSSGRLPLVPVVRNEKESRHRDATHIMYICVYLDCRQPRSGTRKGETNKFRVCTSNVLRSGKLIWSCAQLFRARIGSQALGRRSSNRVAVLWNELLEHASGIRDH
jgi:hypothetical protein